MTALLSIDLPVPLRLAPAVGLEPVNGVRIGKREDLTSTRAQFPSIQAQHIRVPAEEAFTVDHLRASLNDVAAELAARLIAAFRRECR
jgi:hypothetical protein